MLLLLSQFLRSGGAFSDCRERKGKKMSNNYCGTTSWAITACDYCESTDQVELLEISGVTARLCKKCFDRYIKKEGIASC